MAAKVHTALLTAKTGIRVTGIRHLRPGCRETLRRVVLPTDCTNTIAPAFSAPQPSQSLLPCSHLPPYIQGHKQSQKWKRTGGDLGASTRSGWCTRAGYDWRATNDEPFTAVYLLSHLTVCSPHCRHPPVQFSVREVSPSPSTPTFNHVRVV